VDRRAARMVSTGNLRFGHGRAFGRRHRITGGAGRLVLVGKE
jgi:hypothetical protein